MAGAGCGGYVEDQADWLNLNERQRLNGTSTTLLMHRYSFSDVQRSLSPLN